MGMLQKRKWCKECDRYVLATAQGANHILHLLLSLISFGLWLPIWFLCCLVRFRCPQCGRKL